MHPELRKKLRLLTGCGDKVLEQQVLNEMELSDIIAAMDQEPEFPAPFSKVTITKENDSDNF